MTVRGRTGLVDPDRHLGGARPPAAAADPEEVGPVHVDDPAARPGGAVVVHDPLDAAAVTADHDDRVVPAHSFKYAATLQALASHDTPLLIRIETNSAHGASGLEKQLDTAADIYTFIMFNLGVTPLVPGAQTAPSTGN